MKKRDGSILLAFFESSSRTLVSFQKAAADLGFSTFLFQEQGSSFEKGESLQDTFALFDEYQFRAIVLRHADASLHGQLAARLETPLINAGSGTKEHPTQAAGDAFCLLERDPQRKWRVAFFGDSEKSRVFHSSARLFQLLGWDVALCSLGQKNDFGLSPIDRAQLKDYDVVYALRTQRERGSVQSYRGLNQEDLGSKALLMHAGPVIHGEEVASELVPSLGARSLILDQVRACYKMRQVILGEFSATPR